MKTAAGKYVQVANIDIKEAIAIAQLLFNDNAEGDKLRAEGDKLRAEGYKLWAEGDKLMAEGYKLWAEGNKLRAEGNKLRAEGYKLWAEIAITHKAYLPEWRAMNLIANDRENAVYCFVFTRRELWVYDGETCPDVYTVEKIDWTVTA